MIDCVSFLAAGDEDNATTVISLWVSESKRTLADLDGYGIELG
jgi:hypothetical protein